MEILGVGLPEFGFIVLLALILLGPKDMVKAGQTIGRNLRKFITSPTWKAMQSTGREIQQLPTKLMREAGLEELQELEKEARDSAEKFNSARIGFDENQIFAGPPAPQPAPPSNEPQAAPADSTEPPSA